MLFYAPLLILNNVDAEKMMLESENCQDAHKDIANTRQNKNIKDPQKKYRLETVSKYFTGELKPV